MPDADWPYRRYQIEFIPPGDYLRMSYYVRWPVRSGENPDHYKATLNPPDPIPRPEQLAQLPRLPRDEAGPIFAEPWQATAFALAVRLSAEGQFTWKEWAHVLAEELKADELRGEPDDGSRYYHCWLMALERLVIEKHLSDPASLLAQKEAWAEAYRHTPHGKPVELEDVARKR